MSIQKIFFSLFTPTEIIKAHLLYKEKKRICQNKIRWKFQPFDNYLEELNTTDVYSHLEHCLYIL